MLYLLEDSIPSFSSLIELKNYKIESDLSSSSKVTIPEIDENIGSIFCDVFSKFCNDFDFFKSYDKRCFDSLNNTEKFRDQYIIDIFFIPFFVDIFLSALYTAEYLKSHKYYIRIPELIHFGESISQTNLSESCNDTYVESSFLDTRTNIILKPKKAEDVDNLSNDEYKSAIDIFKGKKISHFWTKLYKTSYQELVDSSSQAIPLFLNNIAANLLFQNNIKIGIKVKDIDIEAYFKWLFVNQKTPSNIKFNEGDKHLLLQYYKLECVFRPRLITEFIRILAFTEENLDDENAVKILIEVLNCKFISPIPIIEIMEYSTFSADIGNSKQQDPPALKLHTLLSCYNMNLFRYPSDYFDLNCFPNEYVMHNFFIQLTDSITKAKKDFFYKLFIQYESLDTISNKLFTSLIDTEYFKDFCRHYSTYFTQEKTAETMLYKRQKGIVHNSLLKYWDL